MTSASSRPPSIEHAGDHDRDLAAITQVISDAEAGFNAGDPELSVAHFARNASAVSAAGKLAAGRDALLEAERARLAGPARDQYARYELDGVVFLRPDVAVAHMRARATTPAGEPIDVGHTLLALYVLVREACRWWVAARQDTLVASAHTPRESGG